MNMGLAALEIFWLIKFLEWENCRCTSNSELGYKMIFIGLLRH